MAKTKKPGIPKDGTINITIRDEGQDMGIVNRDVISEVYWEEEEGGWAVKISSNELSIAYWEPYNGWIIEL